ncbi:MAG: UDP-N-acetylglucosamine 4,6-dehydratase [Idiomarina sp.]|uniref:UDP-N-acetylglucosamine 4,6-dehydratase n=1 Tax=Idiomarina sp. TaxID=1874361 RepID=UPI000C48CB6D|nr:UDP-N-acetylglucosamine 4,6-dehydratase [Idiomarina sp.]MBT42780.1 UDP-N-acetylglucosamine 4,6-dehydratase [Idiomarina sp.]
MDNIISLLIGRDAGLFDSDIRAFEQLLDERVAHASFLVIGGAGTIGQAVSKEIFKRSPKKLHVVDISENNLVELVRDIRSSYGYIEGEFKTYALDAGSLEFKALLDTQTGYDYVLNLSALKHVRSEKDPYTLMRMVDVNITNTERTIQYALDKSAHKYFCVSTDKAANPVNMMGASKRIMEFFLAYYSREINISTARFANVAFSDGSLLHGFNQRLFKGQPIVAPDDVRRYFVTPTESGQLCLMSCLLGENLDTFFPKLSDKLHLISFAEIAEKYLNYKGFQVYRCDNEDEARELATTLPQQGLWPCYFSSSDTTGEKDFEEFFTAEEILDTDRFNSIGVIKNSTEVADKELTKVAWFRDEVLRLRARGHWSKTDIVDVFEQMLPNFKHKDTGKYLDGKM